MRKLLFVTALLFAGSQAKAIDFKTMENGVGVYQIYQRIDNDLVVSTNPGGNASTHTVQGYLLSASVHAVGGNATFQLRHSTGTGSNFSVNVSSPITAISGLPMTLKVREIVQNPKVVVTQLDLGTSAYVRLDYIYTGR
jgi:hypothetical protein